MLLIRAPSVRYHGHVEVVSRFDVIGLDVYIYAPVGVGNGEGDGKGAVLVIHMGRMLLRTGGAVSEIPRPCGDRIVARRGRIGKGYGERAGTRGQISGERGVGLGVVHGNEVRLDVHIAGAIGVGDGERNGIDAVLII